jgi:hypothetical protein
MNHREATEELHELCNKIYPKIQKLDHSKNQVIVDLKLLELYQGLNDLLTKQMKIIRGETDE